MCVLLITTAIFLTEIFAEEQIIYENYSVHTVLPISNKHVRVLEKMQNMEDYHFWTQIKDVGLPVDIMVPPHMSADFENIVSSNAIPTTVMISNVQKNIERLGRTRRNTFNRMHWLDYHNGEEVNYFKFYSL